MIGKSIAQVTAPGILCIDDNEVRVYECRKSLQESGCAVTCACDEAQAVKALDIFAVDVVVVDSRCSSQHTARTVANIKALKPNVRIVLRCENSTVPALWRELVDVVISRTEFVRRSHWLLDELRAIHFPFFTEWFDDWKRRSSLSVRKRQSRGLVRQREVPQGRFAIAEKENLT